MSVSIAYISCIFSNAAYPSLQAEQKLAKDQFWTFAQFLLSLELPSLQSSPTNRLSMKRLLPYSTSTLFHFFLFVSFICFSDYYKVLAASLPPWAAGSWSKTFRRAWSEKYGLNLISTAKHYNFITQSAHFWGLILIILLSQKDS